MNVMIWSWICLATVPTDSLEKIFFTLSEWSIADKTFYEQQMLSAKHTQMWNHLSVECKILEVHTNAHDMNLDIWYQDKYGTMELSNKNQACVQSLLCQGKVQ